MTINNQISQLFKGAVNIKLYRTILARVVNSSHTSRKKEKFLNRAFAIRTLVSLRTYNRIVAVEKEFENELRQIF